MLAPVGPTANVAQTRVRRAEGGASADLVDQVRRHVLAGVNDCRGAALLGITRDRFRDVRRRQLGLPSPRRSAALARQQALDPQIRTLVALGANDRQAAARLGVSRRAVQWCRARHGLAAAAKPGWPAGHDPRIAARLGRAFGHLSGEAMGRRNRAARDALVTRYGFPGGTPVRALQLAVALLVSPGTRAQLAARVGFGGRAGFGHGGLPCPLRHLVDRGWAAAVRPGGRGPWVYWPSPALMVMLGRVAA